MPARRALQLLPACHPFATAAYGPVTTQTSAMWTAAAWPGARAAGPARSACSARCSARSGAGTAGKAGTSLDRRAAPTRASSGGYARRGPPAGPRCGQICCGDVALCGPFCFCSQAQSLPRRKTLCFSKLNVGAANPLICGLSHLQGGCASLLFAAHVDGLAAQVQVTLHVLAHLACDQHPGRRLRPRAHQRAHCGLARVA